MLKDNKYDAYIGRGHHSINDAIFDYLIPRISGRWLDVGANIGTLLSEVPDGCGVDLSVSMVDYSTKLGLDVQHADACQLPFEDNTFDTVVLSCVLEQIARWQDALEEALRVCKVGGKVIGINPIPESEWGVVGNWVKAVVPEEDIKSYGGIIKYPDIEGKYYFEIKKK